MKELKELVNKLQEALEQKEKELSSKDEYSVYSKGYLQNRRNDIQKFSNFINEVSNDPFLKKEIIANFTNKANKIISEIEEIE